MTGAERQDRWLDLAIWGGPCLGIVGSTYFLVASAGWCVTTPCGLVWPATATLVLLAIIAAAAVAAARSAPLGFTAAIVAFTSVLVFLNLLPPFARDELTHHLALPDLFLSRGEAFVIPFAEQSYYPMQLTLLYTPLLAQGWESIPKQLHLLFGLGGVAILYLYLSRVTSAAIAAFVAILMITTPTVVTLATSAYVDLGVFFYSMVAIVGLLRWSETDRSDLLVAAALAAGCAGAVKYNGYLTIAVSLVGILVIAPRKDPQSLAKNLLVFGCFAALPLVPWMIRNWADTGNPMFPLMRGTLGGPPRPDTPSIDIFTRRRFLYGESWLEIVTTPLRAFAVGRHGDPARFDGVFNPLFLLGFAAVIAGRKSQKRNFLWIFAVCILFMVFFLSTFRSRYAVASLAPLAILTALLLDDLRRALPNARRLLPLLGAVALGFNAWHFAMYWRDVSPLPYFTGEETRAHFITRFVPEYPLSEFASTHLDADANIYLAFLGQRGYYWKRPYTYDYYYSGTSLRDAVRHSTNALEVSNELKQLGISHIAASAPLLGRFLNEDLTQNEMVRWRLFANQHLRLIQTHGPFGLYEII